ncbi:MAG: hypothetical protein KBB88_01555 [Candidatus Pacebacteria bacterium]|nr:hypothetical protein [Candidatus Paceibacterota bacterium]
MEDNFSKKVYEDLEEVRKEEVHESDEESDITLRSKELQGEYEEGKKEFDKRMDS